MSCSVSWFFAKIYSVEAQDNTFIGLINTEHEQSVYSEIAVTGGEGGKIVGDQSCLIVVVDMI